MRPEMTLPAPPPRTTADPAAPATPRVWRRVRRCLDWSGCSSLITRRTRGSFQSHALSPTSYLLLLLLPLLLAVLLLVLLLRTGGTLLVLLAVALAFLLDRRSRHAAGRGGGRIRADDPVDHV